jgi:DNA helicase-2/ATP-dependent DNA helicase PcrA
MADYTGLNQEQQNAVYHTEGPLLILAGAGSGKTRAITHRIAYLIEEVGVNPYHIMAITFTNKAAAEMRQRVDDLVSYGAEDVWVATFHSTCVRILRRHIDLLGYDRNFTIYDTDDQKSLLKECYKFLQIDPKNFPERATLGEISNAKNEFKTPEEYARENQDNFRKVRIGQLYTEYQKRLKANNALDFDDLLFKVVELFQFQPAILEQYQERFRYIMVDEYQDTNKIQFLFVSMLARKYRNLCVVGDDDQSIYKFRGADIRNILDFEQVFQDTKVIKLEQNYRSTKNILQAANEVIANNHDRKSKKLWTDNALGEKIAFRQFENEYDEADGIVKELRGLHERQGIPYEDCSILYRTNAQSRVLEEKLLLYNIPYRIFGGINFYQRKEVKDLLSYLKVINNGMDDLAVKRIINVPKRGIGLTTLDKVNQYAQTYHMNFLDALFEADQIPELKRAAEKIKGFTDLIQGFRDQLQSMSLVELFQDILDQTGYRRELEQEKTEEAMARIENIDELMNKIVNYEDNAENPTLDELLEEIALVADIDNLEDERSCVVLMTLHSAKGLEFPHVFLSGMEDGLFPGMMSVLADDPMEMEEERRLCYVGITRAQETLHLSAARRRMVRGESRFSKVSRFVEEIPKDLMDFGKPGELGARKSNGTSGYSGANTFAAPRKPSVFAKPYQSKPIPMNSAVTIDYEVGDTVKHIKFGQGVVTEIRPGGRDYEVTVDFVKVGVKKMFASFAKLKKL